ncbi:MAG: tetratricopeptide repeat protein [Spirochaetaceae bacterium]|nr:tetratricopeptide repeat protein [Spirochaetaceae bacterium]
MPYIAIITIVILGSILSLVLVKSSSAGKKNDKYQNKSKAVILKEASKKLASNPKDPKALMAIADLYFGENNFNKAMKTYRMLVDLCAVNPDLDEYRINKNYGICAMEEKIYKEAYKSLMIARNSKPEDFLTNAYLGKIEYMMKKYDRAISYLLYALKLQPDHSESIKFLGMSYFKVKKYKEAVSRLNRAVSGHPDDKESLFALAICCNESGRVEHALKIFSHLRPDPVWGPKSALYSGTINTKMRKLDKAIIDYEIGLKHEKIPDEIFMELKYRLAGIYSSQGQLEKALEALRDITRINPSYKDISNQIRKYRELSSNKNLQIYLNAPATDFVSLCRNITAIVIKKTKVNIIDVNFNNSEFVDIIAEVRAQKWEDLILFRYVRTEGLVGQIMVRDLYEQIKELHAGRGFCFSAGGFTENAEQWVEARLIDLISKDKLIQYLNKVEAF